MNRKLFHLVIKILVGTIMVLVLGSQPPLKSAAEPETYASPVHAGCYLVHVDRCKIHVEPFTINLGIGQKLVMFQLVAMRADSSARTTIYDFRPDLSNPLPYPVTRLPFRWLQKTSLLPVVKPIPSAYKGEILGIQGCSIWAPPIYSPARKELIVSLCQWLSGNPI